MPWIPSHTFDATSTTASSALLTMSTFAARAFSLRLDSASAPPLIAAVRSRARAMIA